MENEEKLRSIENICRGQAKAQKKELEEQIDTKIQASIQEEIEMYKKKQDRKNRMALEKLEKEFNISLWELEKEFKQKELEAKNNIISSLYEELKNELIQFTKSPKYAVFLQKSIEEAMLQFDNKKDVTLYVTPNDMGSIIQAFPNAKTMDEKYIGGCIIENDVKMVNNTLLQNLKEKINECKNNI